MCSCRCHYDPNLRAIHGPALCYCATWSDNPWCIRHRDVVKAHESEGAFVAGVLIGCLDCQRRIAFLISRTAGVFDLMANAIRQSIADERERPK